MRQTRPDQTRTEPFFYVTQSCGLQPSFIDLPLLNARASQKRIDMDSQTGRRYATGPHTHVRQTLNRKQET